jgi:hypothetical protein
VNGNLAAKAAKLMQKNGNRDKGGGSHKYGRNRNKCARYRARVGKPRGPGVDGNKKH